MSSYIGKKIRLERITNRETGNTIIVPMDHGMTVGPIAGLSDMGNMVDLVAEGGANAVLGHVGLPLYGHRQRGKDIGLILHLNASSVISTDKDNKVLVNTVEEAIRLGADGVSIHINIGGKDDSQMVKILGDISRWCRKWGMPLLAMMYPRGENIQDETYVENVKIVTRIGAEMGADIVKTTWTGDPDSFKEVVKGCMAPVVIAGGEKKGIIGILETTEQAMSVGARGVAFGRNIFQAEDPTLLTRAIALIVHEKCTVEEAIRETNLKV